jgi:hypothetical protein
MVRPLAPRLTTVASERTREARLTGGGLRRACLFACGLQEAGRARGAGEQLEDREATMADGMSFVEAHDFDKPALWIGNDEEFLLSPSSGIVSWRPRGEAQGRHCNSWRSVPEDRAIPQQGWTHGPSCACRFCR